MEVCVPDAQNLAAQNEKVRMERITSALMNEIGACWALERQIEQAPEPRPLQRIDTKFKFSSKAE